MARGSLALIIRGGYDNWAADRWKERFSAVYKEGPVFLVSEDSFDPADIHYAAVWKPLPGELATFSDLKVIFNLGAGVDAVLADPDLPNVPLVRVVLDDLAERMTEYVTMHTLMHHRQQRYLTGCQSRKEWAPRKQWAAREVGVGILGMGVLGHHAAEALAFLGFRVAGWSRTPKLERLPGVEYFAGDDGLDAFLARTDILICLLPLTAETRGTLGRALVKRLRQDGPLGGPVIINAGRGGLQNEAEILACLNDGTLSAATLDVFEQEPLPSDSPLWSHPNVTISPHNAADTDPDAISRYVADQIAEYERGNPLKNVVERSRGY